MAITCITLVLSSSTREFNYVKSTELFEVGKGIMNVGWFSKSQQAQEKKIVQTMDYQRNFNFNTNFLTLIGKIMK